MVLKVIILTVVLVAVAFLAIGIKMFFQKGGEFKKSCNSVDPKTGEKYGCTCGEGKEHCHNKTDGKHEKQ
ncbi:MAG: hypothetical protein KKD31_09740 [Bacteroidetes bacterium]|nr:hypothetical protein [Bacteroidota bacterium]